MAKKIEWKYLRVPAELMAELKRIGEEMMTNHSEGRSQLPSEYCESVPLHYVIARAIGERESHRQRSRRKRPGVPVARSSSAIRAN